LQFLSSTGKAPSTNHLEIAGTKGKMVLKNSQLAFTRNDLVALD
jgi:hypothetical protein